MRFFLSLFISSLMSIYNSASYGKLDISIYILWLGSLTFSIFLSILSCRYNCFMYNFWAALSWFYQSNSSCTCLIFFFYSNSFSFTLFLTPNFINFINSTVSITTFLFVNRRDSHFFLALVCSITPFCSNSSICFRLFFFYLLYLLYNCLTNCIYF